MENTFEGAIERRLNTQAFTKQTKQPDSTLPLTQDYLRLNILSRTTKGLFPDIIPSEENLKELLRNPQTNRSQISSEQSFSKFTLENSKRVFELS
ncbi:hypothetical protein CLV27_0143 [Phorcysia thermohydrogeniphila]|uniref:Uncharacterized protein n=1 Tax=Phorcysia thermohydrogeniphila TaxID=936138 RepID=A0A4R1GPF4_9BACT|nr:hypothetical protein CLV27_0143 [Phorcysia thermohydrogeniphila]